MLGVYVEKGSADIGVVGRDVLLEENPDIYGANGFEIW